jgi:hypothetical protein
MTREQVINLILQMKKLNQREYAEFVYKRENALHPEWDLHGSFLALKDGK